MDDRGSNLVTVSCKDHHKMMISGLWHCLQNERGVDIVCRLDGRSIPAHRIILELFLSPEKLVQDYSCTSLGQLDAEIDSKLEIELDYGDLEESRLEIDLDDRHDDLGDLEPKLEIDLDEQSVAREDGNNLDCLLEFLYNGRVTVQETQLDGLLDVARRLDFRMLADAVQSLKIESLSESTLEVNESEMVMESEPSTADGQDVVTPALVSEALAEAVVAPGNPSSIRPRSQRQRKVPAKYLMEVHDNDSGGPPPVKRRAKKSAAVKIVHNTDFGQDESRTIRLNWDDAFRLDSSEAMDGAPYGASLDHQYSEGSVRNPPSVAANQHTNLEVSDPDFCVARYRHVCDRCDFGTNNETMLRIHQANHDPEALVFRCPWCSKPFPSEVLLQAHHCTKAAAPKTFFCPHCEYFDRDKAAYRVHLMDDHGVDIGPVFKCEECRRPFVCPRSLDRHMQDKHGDGVAEKFACPHCRYETQKQWSFSHHMLTEHQITVKPGDKGVPIGRGHRRGDAASGDNDGEHEPVDPLRCRQCPFVGARSRDLTEHARERHGRPGPKGHRCDVCDRVLSDRNTLRRHVLTHIQVKPFSCHLCSYACNRRDNLRSHLRNVHKTIADSPKPPPGFDF